MPRPEMQSGIFPNGETEGTAPERKEDKFASGISYIHFKSFIQRIGGLFETKVYIPKKGIVTVTNDRTPQRGLAIVLDDKNRREPNESDMLYFDDETVQWLADMGFDRRKLKRRTPEAREQEEAPSYRPIDPEIKKRVFETSEDAAEITGVHRIIKKDEIPPPAKSNVRNVIPEEPEEEQQAG